jgi:hypothetical protein
MIEGEGIKQRRTAEAESFLADGLLLPGDSPPLCCHDDDVGCCIVSDSQTGNVSSSLLFLAYFPVRFSFSF